ncbi:MAG: GNAT family N-acetyltransferase [Acidimicrobiales bacterium]
MEDTGDGDARLGGDPISSSASPTFRPATAGDIEPVAALHADSWRRNYRGAYPDEFLDGPVFADRLAVWSERLTKARPDQRTIVAHVEGVFVGFAHISLDEDATWGALLDNLHVTHDVKRAGIGTGLMAQTARVVLDDAPSGRLYLWVLAQNVAAQAFYDARGGRCVERVSRHPLPGDSLRYAWPDPSILLPPR